jgi:hypothetical protein
MMVLIQGNKAAYAQQWVTIGNDIYSANLGNVGVGTTNPFTKFHLNGSLLIEGTSGSAFWGNSAERDTRVKIDSGSGTTIKQSILALGDRGRTFWEIVKAEDNHFLIWDAANSADRFHIRPDGNVGIGTNTPSSRLHVVGDVTVTGNIAARYQDIAEWVPSSSPISPSTVVVLDPTRANFVMPASEAYDTRVAGVVSSSPGIVLGEAVDGMVKVATTGRVKVKVDATAAPVRIGDLLVTSSREGLAMRSEPLTVAGVQIHRPGTVIGKALEPLDSGQGEILVLLSLQ